MATASLRSQFPFFQQPNGGAGIYLDSAATSQKPVVVIEQLKRFYEQANANVHRASHTQARQTTADFEQTREQVRTFINAASSQEVIWTKGATESINLVASSLAQGYLKPGQRILLSTTEHHANIVPWQQVAQRLNLHLDVIPVDDNGVWLIDAGLEMLVEETALVALGQVSNALGNLNPIEPFLQKAREMGSLTLVDGAQAMAHLPVDVQALNCDFYVFSGHKMFGPTGIGVLYGKQSLLESMPPYQFGGEMIEKVGFEHTSFQALPFKFEAGTPNIAGVLGLGKAVEFIEQHRTDIVALETRLYQQLLETLSTIEGIRLWGDLQHSTATQSLTIDGINSQDLGILLDQQGIAVRVGHHCAMPLMERLGVPGTLRVSLSCYNSEEDIQAFGSALKSAVARLTQKDEAVEPLQKPAIGDRPLAAQVLAARGWDQVYRQIMLAGKQMPRMTQDEQSAAQEVFGCESQVWLSVEASDGQVHFRADSPSKIVRGLLAILLEPLQQVPPQDVLSFDLEHYLSELGLARHLSPSRGNGLLAVVESIKNACSAL